MLCGECRRFSCVHQHQTKYSLINRFGKIYKRSNGKYKMTGLTNALLGTKLECPVLPFGGTDNFDISHNRIIFVSKDPDFNPALNVKSNVYIVRVDSWDGSKESSAPQRVIIPGYEGASTSPTISPDGQKAAFLSMKTAGYEADRNEIFVIPDLELAELTAQRAFDMLPNSSADWDRSPSSISYALNSKSLLAIAEDYGYSRLFLIDVDPLSPSPHRLTNTGYVTGVHPLLDGRIFISGSSLIDNSFYALVNPIIPPQEPLESRSYITWKHSNSIEGTKFGLSPTQVSSIWTPASNKNVRKEIHSIVVRPGNFDSSKKYPVAYLIHGGPQGSWADNWSTRWNPAVFAEQGYIVIAPNPTGSTGYGQEFTDRVCSDLV
jgi:dipeptidyl aminopeptidase/acylaminoacyl peptidase